MKLKNILAAATLAFAFTTAAQAENRVGLLAGIDINKLSGEVASSGSKTGFMGGVFGQYDYNGNLFGEGQLRFIRKGGQSNVLGIETSSAATWLEIPVYAKYKVVTDPGFVPYAFAGPALAFKLGSSADLYNPATGTRTSGDGNFNSIDLGLDFGIGVEYPVYENYNASLSLAYNLGLLDVDGGTGSAQNRGFQIYAGVSMPW